MARRKRKSLGYITLKSRRRKISRAYNRVMAGGGIHPKRRLGVNVFLQRSGDGVYYAWACTSKPGADRYIDDRARTCSDEKRGRTPTAAMKAALVALGRKKELR